MKNMQASVVASICSKFESALGESWASKLSVAPETLRTWKKRGKVPLNQVQRAAGLSGRPINYFLQADAESN